jgi:hypothetical protein
LKLFEPIAAGLLETIEALVAFENITTSIFIQNIDRIDASREFHEHWYIQVRL